MINGRVNSIVLLSNDPFMHLDSTLSSRHLHMELHGQTLSTLKCPVPCSANKEPVTYYAKQISTLICFEQTVPAVSQ